MKTDSQMIICSIDGLNFRRKRSTSSLLLFYFIASFGIFLVNELVIMIEDFIQFKLNPTVNALFSNVLVHRSSRTKSSLKITVTVAKIREA
jgi:hypothetical protein